MLNNKKDNIVTAYNFSSRVHAMTVDVEDYFHVSAFDGLFPSNKWANITHRVERNTHRLLDLFAEHKVNSTFFCLGWVAEHYPHLIKRMADEGHEVCSHGTNHKRTFLMSPAEVREDIRKSKQTLEDIIGKPIYGYRAPSFSITKDNQWVYEILVELGFRYSSSTYPITHDLYGVTDWPRFKHLRKEGIIEVPVSTINSGNKNIGIGGGGYFRLYPYWFSKRRIQNYMNENEQPYNFYFHPWEIDPEQPRVKEASMKSKFRHYLNLSKMEPKLVKLLKDYRFTTMAQAYDV